MGNDSFYGAVPGTELFKTQHIKILKLAGVQQAKQLAAQNSAAQADVRPPAAQPSAQAAKPPEKGPSLASGPAPPSAADSRGPPSAFLPPHVQTAGAAGSGDVAAATQQQAKGNGVQPAHPPTPPQHGASQSALPPVSEQRPAGVQSSDPTTSGAAGPTSSAPKPPSRGTSRRLEYTNCAPSAPPRAGFDLQILGGAIVGQALLAVAHDWVTGGQPANLRIQWQRCDSPAAPHC